MTTTPEQPTELDPADIPAVTLPGDLEASPTPLPELPGRGLTPGGWPYITPDDHPLQYPAVSQQLAEKLEAEHADDESAHTTQAGLTVVLSPDGPRTTAEIPFELGGNAKARPVTALVTYNAILIAGSPCTVEGELIYTDGGGDVARQQFAVRCAAAGPYSVSAQVVARVPAHVGRLARATMKSTALDTQLFSDANNHQLAVILIP